MWSTLRKLFRSETKSLVGAAIASFLSGMCEAFILVLVANLALTIGGDAQQSEQSGLFGLAPETTTGLFVTALVLTVVRLLLHYVGARLSARTIARLIQRVRSETFGDYMRASWEVQASESEASVQDLLVRHVAKVQAALVTSTILITNTFMVAALVLSAFAVDPIAAALIVLLGGVLSACLRPLTLMAKRLGRRQMEGGLVYGVQSREAVELSLEIRAFGVNGDVARRLDEATQEEVAPIYRTQLIQRMISVIYTSAAILVLLVALLGLDTFLDRPLASIGAIVIVLIRALNQTSGVQTALHNIGEHLPFIQNLDAQRERFRASVGTQGRVHIDRIGSVDFDRVGYSYGGDVQALRDLSFHVDPGEAIGLIGPSGSGKSTLIQILLGLRPPKAGAYTVDGQDVAGIDERSWFAQIAFVPQDSRVFDDTIAENIRFFRSDVSQEDVEAAARRAHIHDEIMAMPLGYETVLGSRGGSLSGGQRQRVAIARALCARPSMLVLDEPTSALDMRSESLVHETLNELKGTVTLFVIAHRLSTLNTCDRIMVMHGGELQAFGERDELESSSEFYRHALQLSAIRS